MVGYFEDALRQFPDRFINGAGQPYQQHDTAKNANTARNGNPKQGPLQMIPKITKPIELIEYAIKANQVQADKFNIQIEVEYPEEKMPKLFVDSEKIAWVLTNLLSNAIRYSKENGHVIIGARQEDNSVELYVQDFGKGIDPRYHQSIFDRYFRVPGTKVQGSGLGLSISKDFVEAHGGTLTVQSELGKGSRFVIRLKA